MNVKVSINNIEDLTKDMASVYEELRSGNMGKSQAKELANVSGKLISASKTKMEYNKMVGNKKTY